MNSNLKDKSRIKGSDKKSLKKSDKKSEHISKAVEPDQAPPPPPKELSDKAANTWKSGPYTPIKIGLSLLFICTLSWVIYHQHTLNNLSLSISNRLEETILKIDGVQNEQVEIKKAHNSSKTEMDQKLELLNKNESLNNLSKTVSKLKDEIIALQKGIKGLQDKAKNNSSSLVSIENQINDLPSLVEQTNNKTMDKKTVAEEELADNKQVKNDSSIIVSQQDQIKDLAPPKKLSPKSETIEKIVDKEDDADNDIVILIEDGVQQIIKSIGTSVKHLKSTLKKNF